MSAAINAGIASVTEAVKSAIYTKPREPEDWLDWQQAEQPVEDEERKIGEICDVIRKVIDRNVEEHQHGMRGTHVKGLGYVKGTFTVKEDLPAHLQHGLFAKPGSAFPVIARYANEPSHLKPDTDSMPRGLSMKLFDVPEGNRIDTESYGDSSTQDILMNNADMLELTDLDTTLEIFTLRERHWREPEKLKAELAKRSDRTKQFAPGMLPSKPILGMTMFSQSAFRYGPYIAHFSLVPASDEQKALADSSQYSSSDSYTVLRDHVRSFYAEQPAKYIFRAQFVSDLNYQPVEDASTSWDEFLSPWQDLAVVDFPKQETFSDARRVWWDDKIALSPFNGLEEHKPLGSVNRLRKRVYEASRKHRHQRNGAAQAEPYFPKSIDEMPE